MADQLLSTAAGASLPASYIRPESQRPRLHEVMSGATIPTVDLGSPDKPQIVTQVAAACQAYGFFQVVNHGVPNDLMQQMMAVAKEFFLLPPEEKEKHYSDDPAKKIRLSTSFNIRKETMRNWRDYLRLHCYPLDEFVPCWPSNPPSFKKVVSSYCEQVRALGFRLLGLISLGLGLKEQYLVEALGEQEQHMAVNYYPKCPAPDLTYGLQAHTDPNALTILLQDQRVAGLQVRKDGRWIAVNPQPDALVINIGDQLQMLSNGRYKSVWHRALVNSDKERISVASFLCPCNNVKISPPKELVGEGSPAMYRTYTYDEYYNKFWSRNLAAAATPVAAMEIESRSPPASSSDAEAKPTSLAELVIPAALCVAIYGSIPQDVQLHHQGNALYNPLVTFIYLGVLASLCNVIYALVRPDTCGGGDGENVKRRVTGVAVAFLLVAFVLRVLLVH